MNRFGTGKFPTIRNIMAGILLLPGPIATITSVKQSSTVFLFALNKSKFETAANKLQALDLGSLVYLHGRSSPVFVKKLPGEMGPLLARDDCKDLCTIEEYKMRFELPPPKSITHNARCVNLVETVIDMGLVAPELFIMKPEPSDV